MHKWKKKLRQFSLMMVFTAFVFFIMLISMLAVLGGMRLLNYLGVITYPAAVHLPLMLFILVSLAVGVCVSLFVGRRPLKPWYTLANAANEIANGNYDVRVHGQGPEAVQTLFDSFNHMAQELGSVEMLRNDFVNNFSHEFKTPISSIRGFARMLKTGGLTAQERDEYLDIIINESERLAELADNVLSLSRVEQQTIVTEKERFNLTEQIRLTTAQILSKWREKETDISLSGGEVYVTGNKELLRQVWINLLDNAMKFTSERAIIGIQIAQGEAAAVTITDNGIGMNDETLRHIFDKFYQGDLSHNSAGNGLGLPLVKRIVELHGGTISVVSEEGRGTSITVNLPGQE